MLTKVFQAGAVAAAVVALFAGCGSDAAPAGPALQGTMPSDGGGGGIVSGVNCVLGGDFSGDETFLVDECYEADNGFPSTDVTARFQFTDIPVVRFDEQEVYFVHEARHTATGSGYRIAWAGFFAGDTVTTGTFGLALLRELEASGFEAFVGGCPSTFTSATACAQYAFQNAFHDEPRLCIWNANVGAGGSAGAYCDSKVWGNLATNQLPVAQFFASELSRTTTSATWRFNASGSSDPEGQALTYRWEFSDGFVNTTTSATYERTFTAPGTYTVRLRVTEAGGGLDVQRRTIIVSFDPPNNPPTASFAFSCSGLSCAFTDQSTDSDGSIVSWSWDFGDGTGSGVQHPSHTYVTGGTYSVRLTVTDDNTATASQTQQVSVASDSPLSVSISGATTVSANTICTWFANPSGGNGSYTYEWTRGLSVVATTPWYEADTGTKSFTLTVRVWSDSQTASDAIKVSVQAADPVIPC